MNQPIMTSAAENRTIGDILVDSGRLKSSDVDKIRQVQSAENIPFGEAAIKQGLLTQDDINFALAQQFDYSYFEPKDVKFDSQMVAAYKPFSKVGEDFRALRSQLMLRWFKQDSLRKVLAVVSPADKEGKSFIIANLAIMFAQQGEKTLLIDANLRKPSLDTLFNAKQKSGLSVYLSGRAGFDVIKPVSGIDNLSLLAAGPVAPNPQELLGKSTFNDLLKYAVLEYDVILIDTPSAKESSDGEIVASKAGAALIVANKDNSFLSDINSLASRLKDSGVAVVGTVLNEI